MAYEGSDRVKLKSKHVVPNKLLIVAIIYHSL